MGVHPGEGRLIARSRRSDGGQAPSGNLRELQQKIGIAFRDETLLQEALTHSSFANENPSIFPRDNERLEYLGDAVLQLITAEYLYKSNPSAREGELTQTRSAMVNTNTLAQLSEELGIGDFLYLGRGILKGGGRGLRSLLANAFESVLGAVFLDAGYDVAYHFYLGRFRLLSQPVQDENFKGRLQQVVQDRFGQTPVYDSAAARGPNNRREYTAVVYAGSEPLGTGHGTTKQQAEQEAAKAALAGLEKPAEPARKPARRSRRRKPAAEEQPAADVGVEQPAADAAEDGALIEAVAEAAEEAPTGSI